MDKWNRQFGTTADVGVEAFGPTLKDAFEQQALGMSDIMVDPASVEKRLEFRLKVSGNDEESLLASFLEEVLFLVDARGCFFSDIVITSLDKLTVEAVVRGEEIDPEKHIIKTPVKAVTYHQLTVRHDRDGVYTRVVYDI
ncbi:MAG TPA: archease [Nitrospirota bacterium]|jgi:SHS2 domain-containing protein